MDLVTHWKGLWQGMINELTMDSTEKSALITVSFRLLFSALAVVELVVTVILCHHYFVVILIICTFYYSLNLKITQLCLPSLTL